MIHYTIYTDGACLGNPGPGGWAAILSSDGLHDVIELSGGQLDTTNNRMELTAVIMGLSRVPSDASVTVITDSKYVVDAINKHWLQGWVSRNWHKSDGKPTSNTDLWKQLHTLISKRVVNFEWVKGHAGHLENERCDTLARNEATNIQKLYAVKS